MGICDRRLDIVLVIFIRTLKVYCHQNNFFSGGNAVLRCGLINKMLGSFAPIRVKGS
jgi:hypothetical protein